LFQGSKCIHSGIVHEDVDLAESLPGLSKEVVYWIDVEVSDSDVFWWAVSWERAVAESIQTNSQTKAGRVYLVVTTAIAKTTSRLERALKGRSNHHPVPHI